MLENLCIKEIANQLLQGMDGTQLITDDIFQRINHAVTKKDANEIFLEHLRSKTLSSVDIFCKILRQTSRDYEVHKEVADRLEGDTRILVGPYTSEYVTVYAKRGIFAYVMEIAFLISFERA